MIWKSCNLIKREKTGTDKLGNTIYDDVVYRKAYFRFTPVTNADVNLSERTVNKNTLKILVRDKYENLADCEFVELDSQKYTVKEKQYLTRFVLLYIERV